MCRALLSLALLLATACGGSHLTARDARWLRVDTEHFTLYTDLSERRASEEAQRLERLLAAFVQHGWQRASGKGKLALHLNILMFRDLGEFQRYAEGRIVGYYVPVMLLEPWNVLPAPTPSEGLTIVAHELAHYLAFQGIQNQPAWFSEGIASYFEASYFDEHGRFVRGEVPKGLWRELHSGALPAETLFADDAPRLRAKFYATAWLLVHYLMTERSSEFAKYQLELKQGRSHRQAWSAAFPELSDERVDDLLSEYFGKSQFVHDNLDVSMTTAAVKLKPLAVADRHALHALLELSAHRDSPNRMERVGQDLAQALRADPHHLQAAALHTLIGTRDLPTRIAEARSLTRAHPNEWLAWLTLGLLLSESGELVPQAGMPDPVERARALAPWHPYTWTLLALQLAARDERAPALRMFAYARHLAPTSPFVLEAGADLLARLSECQQLADLLQTLRATSRVHRRAEESIKRVEALAADCRPPP